MLKIEGLEVKIVEEKTVGNSEERVDTRGNILNGISLEVNKGETCALMGPNGSGKSTLAQTIMGSPSYQVISGKILFEGKDLVGMTPSERSLAGVFLSFQNPYEITGVSLSGYLRTIYNLHTKQQLSPMTFRKLLAEKLQMVGLDATYLSRSLNEGFSGGEKKKLEVLQLLLLEPKLAILDELDSGLDVDALKSLSGVVNSLRKQHSMSILLITHYTRILKLIEPDKVLILKGGSVLKQGGKELAEELEEKGFAPFGDSKNI